MKIRGVTFFLTLLLGIPFAVSAWTGPTGSAPSNNVSAPINVSGTAQVKNGDLSVNNFIAFGNLWIYGSGQYLNFGTTASGSSGYGIRDNGGTLEFKNNGGSWASVQSTVNTLVGGGSQWTTSGSNLSNVNSGNVGIGTASPAQKLDVNGAANFTGGITNAGGVGITVNQAWSPAQALSINGNQIWKSVTTGDSALYFQWSNPGGAVIVGGQGGATNQLTVYGPAWVRDALTASSYCIGSSCISSWPSGIGGSGTTGYIPRYTAGTTLGNSSLTSDGNSTTAIGNFFAPIIYDSNNNGYYLDPNAVSNLNQTVFTRDGITECCSSGNYTIALAENTAGNGRQATVQFHDSGVAEGYIKLASSSFGNGREFNMGSYQTTMNVHATGYIKSDQGLCIGGSCITSWPSAGSGFAGSGTTNYISKFTGGTSFGNSNLTDDGTYITLGSAANHLVGSGSDNWFPYVNGYNYIRPASGAVTYIRGALYDEDNTAYYLDANNGSNFNSLTLNNLNTLACFAGTCPPNGAIRMTPNFHFNAGAGYAFIVNWDNGTTGGAQTFRIGNGAGGDAAYFLANGNFYAPIMYDINNVGYYVDPDQSSNTNAFTANDSYVNNWFRVNGGGGIYWQQYGGGWYMQDTTWIRSYNNKPVYLSAGVDTGAASGVNCGGGLGGGYTFHVCGTQNIDSTLNVGGTVTAASFLYSSDERLKENIVPIPDALSKVAQLTGVSFTWRPGTPQAGKDDIGVIAQDVQKVLPEAVHLQSTGFLAVDYPKIIPLLINSINEQQAQISQQQSEIDELKAEISALQNK